MSQALQWEHSAPRKKAQELQAVLGTPSHIDAKKGGFLRWRGQKPFLKHELHDELVPHCVPSQHYDYFSSVIRCYVPPELFKDVHRISGSIAYDGLKKELRARCAGLRANIATLYLAMALINEEMTIQQIKQRGLYAKYIRGKVPMPGKSSLAPHDVMQDEIMRMQKANWQKYKTLLVQPYYALAFPQGCR